MASTMKMTVWASVLGFGLLATSCATQRTEERMDAPADRTGTLGTDRTLDDRTGTDDRRDAEERTGERRDAEIGEVREGVDRRELEAGWGATADDRRALLDSLDDLRDRLDDRKDELDRKMVRTENEQERVQMHEYRRQIERERARVTDAIRNVEVAETENFANVRNEARSTTRAVGDWFDRQGDRVFGTEDDRNRTDDRGTDGRDDD